MWSSLSEPRDLQYLQRGHPFGTNGSSTLQRAGGHLFRTSGVSTPQGACHSFLTQITTIHQILYYHELHPAVYKELVWEKVGSKATVVSFTPGNAVIAQAALEDGNFPVLVCNNKAHHDWCQTTITDYVIAELKKGNDKICPPNLQANLKNLEPARLAYAREKGCKGGKEEEAERKKKEAEKKNKEDAVGGDEEEKKKKDEEKKKDEDEKKGDHDYDYDHTGLGLLRCCRELMVRPCGLRMHRA